MDFLLCNHMAMLRKIIIAFVLVFSSATGVMSSALYGRDNLAAFFAAQVRARTNGTPIKIHVFGDSKVAGIGVADGYRIDQLLAEYASRVGYPVIVTYEGFGGQNSFLWANNEDQDFVLEHPDADLVIVDVGTNEGYIGATGGPQTNAEQKANLLAADAQIRLSRSRSSLSILYLGQTPGNNWNTNYNQTTEHMQEVNAVLKEVAEETNAGYFDTLQIFTRAHGEAGWMEQLPSPAYGDGNVHPGNPLNLVLVGELGKALFPFPFKFAPTGEGACILTLQNGWSAWTAPATAYTPRAKLKDGVVNLDGLIKKGGKSPAETVLFTLPTGFRPAVNRFVSAASDSNGGTVTLQILSSGPVRIGGEFSGAGFISLDGISFRVD